MKISILIAAHEGSPSLSDTLASVAAQTHADWDLTVLAYGAPGGLEDVVTRFAEAHSNVRYEQLAEPHGAAVARNRLLTAAAGEAIAFLEPGDVWLPRHLANAAQHIEAGADVVVANIRPLDAKPGRGSAEISIPSQVADSPTRTIFSKDAIPSVSCVVLRRTVALGAGSFDPRFKTGEARDFWLRCAMAGARFAVTHRATCQCASAPRTAESALQTVEQTALFYEKHRDLAAVPAALRRRLLAGSLVAQGRMLRKSDPSRAARCFWRAWSLQPVHVQTLGQFALTGSFAQAPDRQDTP